MKTCIVLGKTWLFVSAHLKRLGSKDEAYYKTEKEMLDKTVYNYDSLSADEKEIYNNLKNKL